MTKVKKKSRRSDLEFPALSPHHNLKSRYEEIEDLASYAHTLSKENQAWLNSYAQEEICANFNHNGQKLNDSSDPEVRRRVYNRNNQRNRCIMSREKSMGQLNYLEDLDIDNTESAMVEDNYE